MTLCGGPLLWSLLGVKRTSLFAAHMSAYDPKRTKLQTTIAYPYAHICYALN